MTSHNQDKTNRVSAFDTVLKLLLTILNQIKYYMGLFFIDNLMRNIVSWYDKRHLTANLNLEAEDRNDIQQIKMRLYAKDDECRGLQSKLDVKCKENQYLKEQIYSLSNNVEDLKESYACLQHNISVQRKDNDMLKHESEELRKRCLPETDVPSMIYFAQGDTTGSWLRKLSATKSKEHIYRLTTKSGDTTICDFYPINQGNMDDVIANRNITLLACDIISIAPAASSIEIVEQGEAVLENNRWKVIHKAKIKLV